ncbi:hypothetical protein [Lentzea sp. NPDC051838]|uniref:hypothetical protein n=1 Tax=Lentzea sp. NPDC051838 TaxID=3154849 RepID=UPI0034123576
MKRLVFVVAALLSMSTTAVADTPLKGWELTTANTGLAGVGLTCAALPEYTGDLKPASGSVLSEVRVTGPLDLSNGNITVSKSCIKPTSTGYHNNFLVTTTICGDESCWATPAGNVVIKDSDIDATALDASAIAQSCAFLGVGKLYRNEMFGMGSGICFFETGEVHDALAEGNYVHGLRSFEDSHNEAATIRDFVQNAGDTRTVKFLNNRLDCTSGNATGGLFIQPTWLPIHNVTIQDNYLEGEGYNLYLEETGNATYGNVRAINNRFRPTGWGPAATPSGPGYVQWDDNHLYSTTAPDHKGAVVDP